MPDRVTCYKFLKDNQMGCWITTITFAVVSEMRNFCMGPLKLIQSLYRVGSGKSEIKKLLD